MKPFLKWAGGKASLLPELRKHVPEKMGCYYEPFVGGGALFFDLQPKSAVLGDLNDALIETYKCVRSSVAATIECLDLIQYKYLPMSSIERREFYNQVRAGRITDVAARTIFLNKTCFNGLWRTNKSGQFNVPHGKYANPKISDAETLGLCSEALSVAFLQCLPFQMTVAGAVKGDFVYFDPPYIPASATSNFTAYGKLPFGQAEHERLRDCALRLKKRGVKVLLSNSDTPEVRKLYAHGFEMRRVEARRNINSNTSKRGPVGEVLIW